MTAQNISEFGEKPRCTQAYTFRRVLGHVIGLYAEKHSLRRIAKEDYRGEINHAVIQRILSGQEPRDRKIRRVLGLVDEIRPRRIAIRCDDMHSAAKSITNNLDPEQVRELIEELT